MFQTTVKLDGRPLRYAFVSHHPDFADPVYTISDGDGVATFESIKKGATIDIIVHAQNLAVRMLDGATPSIAEKSLRFRNKKNGATLNITKANKSFQHYEIMDRCYQVYETVFQPLPPFNSPARRAFPFGGVGKPAHEMKRGARIDCRFPESLSPGKLPWVQPQSVTGGVPLMHLKSQRGDQRLFGTAKKRATTVPHEFAHAMHFAMLSSTKRWILAAKYGLWIAGELAARRSATHRTEKRTVPLIAFVEAFGIFSQRFYFFATEAQPDLRGARLRSAFVEDELSASPALAAILPGYVRIGTRQDDGSIRPSLHGASTEGAVYGALFLDFASRASLADAVNLYLRCGGFDYDDYVSYAAKQRKGRFKKDLAAVTATWNM